MILRLITIWSPMTVSHSLNPSTLNEIRQVKILTYGNPNHLFPPPPAQADKQTTTYQTYSVNI